MSSSYRFLQINMELCTSIVIAMSIENFLFRVESNFKLIQMIKVNYNKIMFFYFYTFYMTISYSILNWPDKYIISMLPFSIYYWKTNCNYLCIKWKICKLHNVTGYWSIKHHLETKPSWSTMSIYTWWMSIWVRSHFGDWRNSP